MTRRCARAIAWSLPALVAATSCAAPRPTDATGIAVQALHDVDRDRLAEESEVGGAAEVERIRRAWEAIRAGGADARRRLAEEIDDRLAEDPEDAFFLLCACALLWDEAGLEEAERTPRSSEAMCGLSARTTTCGPFRRFSRTSPRRTRGPGRRC